MSRRRIDVAAGRVQSIFSKTRALPVPAAVADGHRSWHPGADCSAGVSGLFLAVRGAEDNVGCAKWPTMGTIRDRGVIWPATRGRSRGRWLGRLFAVLGGVAASPVFAQAQQVPPTLDPNRLRGNLTEAPDLAPAPQLLSQVSPDQAAPETAKNFRFAWQDFRFEGATAIPIADLLAGWRHAKGDEVSLEDVFRFTNSVSGVYARKGYALTFGLVPQQQIKDGIVVIRVVEGFVDKVTFTGDKLPRGLLGRRGAIAAIARKIQRSRPLRTADLERYLLLINDIAGVEARAAFSPSPTAVGGSVLSIHINRRRRGAEFGYNNYLPESLGAHVASETLDFNGLLTGTDHLAVSTSRSVPSDAYWSVAGDYSSLVGREGLTLSGSVFYAETRPTVPLLQALDYAGSSLSIRAAARYPVIRSRRRNLTIELSTALSNSDSVLLGQASLRDRLRSVRLGATYQFSDASQAVTSLSLGGEKGLSVLDGGGTSRAFGRADYSLFTFEVQRLQPLGRFLNGRLSATVSAQGQLSVTPLFSATECSYGGRRFGRRFDSGELSGDHCALGSAELRWTAPVRIGATRTNVQIYGFADGGAIWQKGRLIPGERRSANAVSAGGGFRLDLGERISAGVEASRAVRSTAGPRLDRSVRILGAISFHF